MLRTIPAIIDQNGHIRFLEQVKLPSGRRVLITILDDESLTELEGTAQLSEKALAEDWNRPEEDKVWSHLQSQQ